MRERSARSFLLHPLPLRIARATTSTSKTHGRPTSCRATAVLLICSLLLGLSGIVVGTIAVSRPANQLSCSPSPPLSVSVKWETEGSAGSGSPLIDGDGAEGPAGRREELVLVGIQTGFDRAALQRLEEATGLAFRFIIGWSRDEWQMLEPEKEIAEHDDFLVLDFEEEYTDLPYKTLAYFKAVYALIDAEFYVKADDSIYLRPDRLSLLLAQKRTDPRTYLRCMKKGLIFRDHKPNWYEPLYSELLGKEYFLHAYGPIYALSADVVGSIVNLGKHSGSFRMFRHVT